jgi:ABC-type branched-subunit amino acid transport system ATPase component/ABC-type branched-subunit amino acid transport system permease subunit
VNGAVASLAVTRKAFADGARDLARWWRPGATAAVAVLALAAVVPPLLGSAIRLDALAATLYLALAAVGLGLTVGRAGIPSLGQGAFMGIGAFVAAALLEGDHASAVVAALAGAAAAALAGAAAGFGFVRLRPVFVAVGTWILSWLVAFALVSFPSLSGGAGGRTVSEGSLAGIALTPGAHYELALALVAVAAGAVALLSRGVFGLRLAAARDHAGAAAALGIPVTQLRVAAFVVSAGIAGLAGGFAVQLARVADPTAYGAFLSFVLLVAVLLGGASSAIGPLAGVLALSGISLAARAALFSGGGERWNPMLAALLLVIVLSAGGAGLVPWARSSVRRSGPALARRAQPPAQPAAILPVAEGAAVEARHLVKRFGALAALDGVSFALQPGSVTALIGPNGSGKTTALRLLSGAQRPDEGQVLLAGEGVTEFAAPRRVELGLVRTLQATAGFPELSALEHVLVGSAVRRRYGGAVRELGRTPLARAEAAGARDRALALLAFFGLEHAADTRAAELPGFERRLLMLAAALATEPRALLVDEPAAGAAATDLPRLAAILEAIGARGVTLCLVEHNLRLVRSVATRVLVLDAGRLIADGSPAEVARDPDVRSAYLGRRTLA